MPHCNLQIYIIKYVISREEICTIKNTSEIFFFIMQVYFAIYLHTSIVYISNVTLPIQKLWKDLFNKNILYLPRHRAGQSG